MTARVQFVVSLRPVTDENRAAVEALRVAPGQERFVSNVVDSMIEAVEEPAGRAMYWAVYAGETPVGFVMITDEVAPDSPGYIPHYLWKLLIDHHHQQRGYGTATLDLIVEYFRARPGVDVLRTSAGQGEGSPIGFYERYGFERAGDIVFDDEALLQLRLESRPSSLEQIRKAAVDAPEQPGVRSRQVERPMLTAARLGVS